MAEPITVRRAESMADYHACQSAQRAAWGITEENYVVPIATMVGAQLHGGLVLGAFLPDGSAVGMSFAFLGAIGRRVGLYSQLTGVVPGHQDQGVGQAIKLRQREIAREQGLPCIAWAFDPLQAGNARFNLEKLGAVVERFIPDMYGPRTDALNRNATTDRLVAVWETTPGPSARPVAAEELADLPRLIARVTGPGGEPEPAFAGLADGHGRCLLEIPAEISRLRAEDPDAAAAWGIAARRAFESAFAAGFRAVGFVREDAPEGRRAFYVLERNPSRGEP